MRKRGRTDANQKDIVDELRKRGYSVAITSGLGSGFPDIIVGYRGRNYLFEIKDPAKPPSACKLTEDEHAWHLKWRGHVAVVYTADDCVYFMTK